MDRCDKQDKELMEIKTEFGNFKKEVSKKLDELFDEVRKPILTDRQMASLILSLVVYLIFTINYISGNNFRSISNENSIIKSNLESTKKDEKMMDLLIEIKSIVDKNEGRKEVNK